MRCFWFFGSGLSGSGHASFFRIAFYEQVVGLYHVNTAQGEELHQARVGLFAGFQAGDISLGDPAPMVRREFRNTRYLAHR